MKKRRDHLRWDSKLLSVCLRIFDQASLAAFFSSPLRTLLFLIFLQWLPVRKPPTTPPSMKVLHPPSYPTSWMPMTGLFTSPLFPPSWNLANLMAQINPYGKFRWQQFLNLMTWQNLSCLVFPIFMIHGVPLYGTSSMPGSTLSFCSIVSPPF